MCFPCLIACVYCLCCRKKAGKTKPAEKPEAKPPKASEQKPLTKRKTISEEPKKVQPPKDKAKDLDKSRSQSNLIDENQTTVINNQNLDTVHSDDELKRTAEKQKT